MAKYSRPQYFDVTSADGTRLRAWRTKGTGPVVLLCNGLGTNPYAWPGFLTTDAPVQVISWNHRGIGGSARPVDPDYCGQDAFVADAIAVMDHFKVKKCVLVGWSIGVNTMFELTRRYPKRVTGLFAVAGVHGDTFASFLAPLGVPKKYRRPVSMAIVKGLEKLGRPLNLAIKMTPMGHLFTQLVSHSGFMFPVANSRLAGKAIRQVLQTPMQWYMHLALASANHPRRNLEFVTVPTAFVAGKYDVLSDTDEMRELAAQVPGASYLELPGTHFISMERPDEINTELVKLLNRIS